MWKGDLRGLKSLLKLESKAFYSTDDDPKVSEVANHVEMKKPIHERTHTHALRPLC